MGKSKKDSCAITLAGLDKRALTTCAGVNALSEHSSVVSFVSRVVIGAQLISPASARTLSHLCLPKKNTKRKDRYETI